MTNCAYYCVICEKVLPPKYFYLHNKNKCKECLRSTREKIPTRAAPDKVKMPVLIDGKWADRFTKDE